MPTPPHPPIHYIPEVADILKGTRVKIGAQNMHWDDQGPWTGEVSAPVVKDCGATMVELGHSERRIFLVKPTRQWRSR